MMDAALSLPAAAASAVDPALESRSDPLAVTGLNSDSAAKMWHLDADSMSMDQGDRLIYEQLDRDIARLRIANETRQLTRKCCNHNGGVLAIVNGTQVHTVAVAHDHAKWVRYTTHLQAILSPFWGVRCGLAPVPDVVVQPHMTSTGAACSECAKVPLLVMAKRRWDSEGLLVPNPYFGEHPCHWEAQVHLLRDYAASRPWSNRSDPLFWRGQIVKDHCSGHDMYGSYARSVASGLTRVEPSLFDVKLTGAAHTKCSNNTPVNGKGVDKSSYSTHRNLLNLPGSSGGSYSRNLNDMWLQGGAVWQWGNRSFVEWYYPALRDRVDWIRIDTHNAVELAKAYKSDDQGDAELQRIASRASGVHDRYLCTCCQVRYVRNVLRRVAQTQPIPNYIAAELAAKTPALSSKVDEMNAACAAVPSGSRPLAGVKDPRGRNISTGSMLKVRW